MPLPIKKIQLTVKDGNEYKDGDLLFNIDAQAWARGTRAGQPVSSTDETYHNNAKYYVDSSVEAITTAKTTGLNAINSAATTGLNSVTSATTTGISSVNAAATNAIANFPATADACDTLAGDFAPTYVANQAYSIGDYVTYQYQLYQCNTNIEANTDSSFVTTHWSAVKVGSKLNSLKDNINTLIPRNLADGVAIINGKYINYSTGAVSTSTDSKVFCTELIDVSAYSKVLYSRYMATSSALSWGIFFYDSEGSPISGSGKRAGLGYSVTRYDLTVVAVPNGAKYIRLTGYSPLGPVSLYDEVEYTTKINQNAMIDISGQGLPRRSINPEASTIYGYISSNSNTWMNESTCITNGHTCGIIPIPCGVKIITIKAHSTEALGVAILTTKNHVSGEAPDYATGWTSRVRVIANTIQSFVVPDNGAYLYYTKTYGNVDEKPQYIYFYSEMNPLGLHQAPPDESALNIVKRCRQLTDIKWTPAVDLPRLLLVQRGGDVIPSTTTAQYNTGTFKAGVEYKGIPYGTVTSTMSSYGYSHATVGPDISLQTFVSSVSSPKSKLCVENATIVASGTHRSLLYAGVCSGLACYALNVPETVTASIPNISGLVSIGKVNNNGTYLDDELFKIGYILNHTNDHVGIITDIIRNDDGTIKLIEISELTSGGLADKNFDDGPVGGLARRKGWTREDLHRTGISAAWGDYTLFRYTNPVPYEYSPYVNVGDEFDGFRIDHFPIIPYEGDSFVYKTGHIPNNQIKLVINVDGYAYVRVFKDGTQISGSPFTVISTTTSGVTTVNPINITEISTGNYTAYLCNITNGSVKNSSYACHWSIQ